MIIGDKKQFGIEFYVDEEMQVDSEDAAWLWGKTCWWVCDQSVGDMELDTTIRDVGIELLDYLANRGNRRDDVLFELSKADAYHQITSALFGDSDDLSQEEAPCKDLLRFWICPEVSAFNNWHIYMIEGDNCDRLIWRNFIEEPNAIHECKLARGVFYDVSRQFLSAISPYLKNMPCVYVRLFDDNKVVYLPWPAQFLGTDTARICIPYHGCPGKIFEMALNFPLA